jgi:hypothetical protein
MTNEPAVLSNFDPIAIGDEIAALETEAQSKLADAKGEFASRSEKIAAILWEVKEHHMPLISRRLMLKPPSTKRWL